MGFIEQFTSELSALSHEGGWIFWCLVLLAFAIAFSLLSVWESIRFSKREKNDPLKKEADIAKTSRRIQFAFVLIGAAPLIGLLGTVSGMFATFTGLSASSVSAPMDVISRGISEALITTQTGLIIAVPTFIVCTFLKNKHGHIQSELFTDKLKTE